MAKRSKTLQQRPLARLPQRMTDVLSRVAVDLDKVGVSEDGAALVQAALQCRDCENADKCDDWIGAHEEGDGAPPPHFCRLGDMMGAAPSTAPGNRSKRPRSSKRLSKKSPQKRG